MVAFERKEGAEYDCEIKLINLSEVANKEKKVPLEWINPDDTGMTKEFIDYALPLVKGESAPPFVNGLPRYAKLAKIPVAMNG